MMGLGEGGRKRAAAMWYLVGLPSYQNLTDMVEEILARCHTEIRQASKPLASDASAQETGGNAKPASALPDWHVENDPLAGSVHLARHAERLDRYQQLVQLHEEGLTRDAK